MKRAAAVLISLVALGTLSACCCRSRGCPPAVQPGWIQRDQPRPATSLDAKEGDKVEIEWGARWWPGVVKQVRGDAAYVHYDGYGPEWDEWVTPPRVRPRNP